MYTVGTPTVNINTVVNHNEFIRQISFVKKKFKNNIMFIEKEITVQRPY
jgi:hypothetical protein